MLPEHLIEEHVDLGIDENSILLSLQPVNGDGTVRLQEEVEAQSWLLQRFVRLQLGGVESQSPLTFLGRSSRL